MHVDDVDWEPRRVAVVPIALPEGVTPPGTRGRILEQALALYAENGFHGTSIRSIAARVGINSATLYAHYPSKEQVLVDLVLIGHRELYRGLSDALGGLPAAATAAERLAALVRAHVLLHTDYPLLAVVINAELHALSAEQGAPVRRLRGDCRRLLLDVLEQGVADGEFLLPDIRLAAAAMSSMGVQVAQWFGPDQPYRRDEVAEHYVRFALRIAGVPEH